MLMLLEVGAGLDVDTSCRKAAAVRSSGDRERALPGWAVLLNRRPPVPRTTPRRPNTGPRRTSPGSSPFSPSALASPSAEFCSAGLLPRRARWGATSVSIRPKRSSNGATSAASSAVFVQASSALLPPTAEDAPRVASSRSRRDCWTR